ncbi:lipopolysaccharide biosynthesis protein [Aquisediminimonas profunda]|uniref:lipopolysaccharide biosynthesis protein n=1 Tax=Aquisediminimonas profunda TaxID=1550733 RepID=UPI001C635C41|nr:lipopolysaccharide biosynthesis protein [Aquisediminimonas profunda]
MRVAGGSELDDIEALAKGGRTNVAGFFVRLIARIPFLFIAGQWYGAAALGRLAYAVLVLEFAAQLATLGLKRGLALHLSGDGKQNGVWDALALVLACAVGLTIALMLVPRVMFPNSDINGFESLLPLVIPALALTDLMLAALAYRYDVGATVRAKAIIEPWTISIGAFALSWYSLRDGLLIAYALSMGAALITAAIPFFRAYGFPVGWAPTVDGLYRLARRNLPLAAADGIEWGSRRLDLAILGLFVSPATVGIYYVAQQVASLPQKLKTSFDPILGPVITRKLEKGDTAAVARQVSQVGFWIIAAQTGIALALGIPGEGLMGLFGPKGAFVGGNGALAFLLLAEVAAAVAVVSEAALVYIARHRNFLISGAMIAFQAALTFIFLFAARQQNLPELYQAAMPAVALAISLGLASLVKANLAASLLGAPVSVWRWPLVWASAAAITTGSIAIRLPEWAELVFGIPAILLAYGVVIWRWGFAEEDRALFRKAST